MSFWKSEVTGRAQLPICPPNPTISMPLSARVPRVASPFLRGLVADALAVDEAQLDRAPARLLQRGDLAIEGFFGFVGESSESERHGRVRVGWFGD